MRRRIALLIVAALLTVTFPAAKPGESKPGSAKSNPRTSEEKTEDDQKEDRPKLSRPADKPADKPSASSRPVSDRKPAEKPPAGKPAASRTADDEPQSDSRSKPAVKPASPAPQPDDKEEKAAATFDPSGSLIRASRQVRPEPPARPPQVAPNEPGPAGRGGRRGGWNPPPEPPGFRRHHNRRPRWTPPHYPHHHYRGRWRRNYYHYCGSWSFLIWSGPVIYCPPPRARRYPTVIRLPSRTGVYVRQTGDDAIGRAFAAALREELRNQGQRVVYDADRAGIELYIISMEQDPEDPGWASSVSVSYISHPGDRFITTQLLDCGDEQVNDLADYVAGYADDLAKDYCY